ncbi:MAG: SIMPL domain-containing protein [bacterium]|nr:SIMPL domain-containing protein [bacterium]
MNNTYKFLGWLGAVFLVVLSVFFIVSTNEKLNTAATTNTIVLQGSGKVLAKPDVAIVDFSIVTEGATSKDAQDKNSPKSKAVSDFLKKEGVEDKDIKTTTYNIYPQYVYPQYGGQAKITGYQVTQGYQVKIRDLDKASDIVDGLVTAGANNVNQLQFTIDEPEKLKEEARAKAIADAKEKASKLESQIGIRLGKIVNFSESTYGYPGPVFYDKAMSAEGRGGGGPTFPAGENEVTVDITLTYQIK